MENGKKYLELGTKVKVVDENTGFDGLTGVVTARKGESCHYHANCEKDSVRLVMKDYEVKIDCLQEVDEEGYYTNFALLDEDEIEAFGKVNRNTIMFAKLRGDAIIPSKREEDGAFDIYSCFDEDYMVIRPHETKMIPTGLCSAFSSDYVAILKERGSTGTKGIGQRCGVVDSGYRGAWFVPITNHSDKTLIISKLKDYTIKENKKVVKNKKNRNKAVISYGFVHDNIMKVTSEKGFIIYPYEKAISQVIMVQVPKLSIKESALDEVMAVSSERGTGALGSSGK